jgi:N-acetylglucosaminyldiphosphoundecaprenol N-acetyl-beta-D-mannosaminyltransferase
MIHRGDIKYGVVVHDSDENTWDLDGVRIFAAGLAHAASVILGLAEAPLKERLGTPVRLVNTYTFSLARKDADYRSLITGPGLNLPDGTPIRWLSKLDGRRLHMVRGPSLFLEVLRRSSDREVSHYLLGGAPETLEALQKKITSAYPACSIAGSESPPFRPLTSAEVSDQDARIVASGASIVWVGTGTPRQDYEAARLAREYGIIAVGVGAAFDFASGAKIEAPRHLQGSGLEWVFRLSTEPRRLWRRYLSTGTWFLRELAHRSLHRSKGGRQ